MARETWKPILYPGLEGEYCASSEGRIRVRGKRHRGRWRKRAWQILAPYLKDDPYPRVAVYVWGERVKVRVHVLVLYGFKGPPKPGQIARHLDDDKHNVRAINLRWGTYSENMEDAVANGRIHRLGKARAAEIRRRAEAKTPGLTKQLAEAFGISTVSVSAVIRGETYAEGAA